ncbi:MAG TPA: hypothetical protein VFV17_09800 [Usitatibacteraceae bacterium]|nr:hypothetical protein [Usitatibacteraceae bacterium]
MRRPEMTGRPPEDTPRRDLAVSAILRFGLTILLCWLPFWKFGVNATAAGFALLIFFPCSFMLAKPIMGIAAEFGDWFGRSHLTPWQGIYYNFANVQLRMFEVGPELWVVDTDLLKVIGEKPSLMLESLYDAHEYDTIPGTRLRGFSPEGAQKLLMASEHFESKRALLWLQREVWKVHRRKRELAAGKR